MESELHWGEKQIWRKTSHTKQNLKKERIGIGREEGRKFYEEKEQNH